MLDSDDEDYIEKQLINKNLELSYARRYDLIVLSTVKLELPNNSMPLN